MKKIILFIILTFIVNIIFAQSQSEPKINFKIATDAPDGSSWIMTFKEIDKQLRKQTNNEIGLTIYPASIMGDQSTVIKKIKIGQLSGAGLSSGGMQLIYKDFAIMGFPLIFRNYKEYDYTKEKLGSFFDQELEKKDFVILSWTEVGFIYVCSKKKVNSAETLSQSKPIILEGDIVSKALYDELNIKPIPLQLSDILTSLQTGQIDTIFSSTYGLIVTQWFTKVNYIADFPITFMIGSCVVDKKMFYSLTKEQQTLMRNLFKENFGKLAQKVRQDNDKARISLEKQGIKFIPVDDKQKQRFVEVCTNAYKVLTEKEYSKEMLDKVLKVVDEYRNSNK
ncbi:MAG: hypothetical protein A2086_14640 [Spirochaetes bacterium GWD1_27_9]|nr:MAG: hypothetical protein A2Z98_04760 [Spirochaetes bacterium GWB1_27_13]OHD24951.1 MAG: hypothetical protein A2Y34_06225 [Spirochaetes bacterium GWC1_27_15]OHD38545.1 MAG: hypothetical protein A2086_14640 [Spirochaetes bacterium GWD1_27_9]